MLLGGDEIGRTQGGNNNGYCQDNEISWMSWDVDERKQRLLEFTTRLIELRREHPVFRRSTFLAGVGEGTRLPDSWWFRPDGLKMTRKNWEQGGSPCIGVFLNGEELRDRTPQGEPIVDASFLILFNAHHERCEFVLPPRRFGRAWEVRLSTADPDGRPDRIAARDAVTVESRSLLLLQRV
jgi:glycogen operon protein